MCDPELKGPWSSDDLTWRGRTAEVIEYRMADMRRELGRRESPAFERLRDYLHVPSELPGRVIAELVEMVRPRCFADSQSYRQYRGAALWAELQWLSEEMLIDAFDELTLPQYYQWRSGALVNHANAGPALWTHVLSGPVHVKTIVEINAAANARGDRAFLKRLENSLATLDIVKSVE